LGAYPTDGVPISDPVTPAQIAEEAGLDAAEVATRLASERHCDAVRDDQAQAAATASPASRLARLAQMA